MKDIAIYGAGGYGREVACMIKKLNNEVATWNLIGFFDDGKEAGDSVGHFGRVLGDIDTLNSWEKPLAIAICIGNPDTVGHIRSKIENPYISFPNLIDSDFAIDDPTTFKIGIGNIIKGHCSCTTNIRIGNFNLFNGFVNMGHDVVIGDFNSIMPGARISGEVNIGKYNLIGSDSFIKQQIKIGQHVTLSPLSALLTKPKDGNTYIGNPAKIFKY